MLLLRGGCTSIIFIEDDLLSGWGIFSWVAYFLCYFLMSTKGFVDFFTMVQMTVDLRHVSKSRLDSSQIGWERNLAIFSIFRWVSVIDSRTGQRWKSKMDIESNQISNTASTIALEGRSEPSITHSAFKPVTWIGHRISATVGPTWVYATVQPKQYSPWQQIAIASQAGR